MKIAATLGAFVLVACGATQTHTDPIPLFDADGVEAARREAPDLVAAAERAADEARAADESGDGDAARDHATRARLLLEAAIVEADRASMDRQRLEAQRATEEATRAAVVADEGRATLEVEQARQNAAQVARGEMRRAFEQAEQDEGRRLRRRSQEVEQARRAAALALRDRARLVLAAALALGAARDDATEIEESITTAGSAIEQLQNADRAHRRALGLLGAARLAHPVDAAARSSLIEAIEERDLEVSLEDRGLVLRGVTLARVQTLAQLISAHPHGPVEVRGRGASGFARRLKQAGIEDDRLSIHAGSTPIELVFLGYGNAPAGVDVD